jgi:hypothetical protein
MSHGLRRAKLGVKPRFQGTQGAQPAIEGGINQPQTDQGKEHIQAGPKIENHLRAALVCPFCRDFLDHKTVPFE